MIIQFFILSYLSIVCQFDKNPLKIYGKSSVFVNPSRTIKSAVECLESSYFPVRRFGSGYLGKISPTFMKSWCSCQNNQMAYNGPASMWGWDRAMA
jgi:hypothetical protein